MTEFITDCLSKAAQASNTSVSQAAPTVKALIHPRDVSSSLPQPSTLPLLPLLPACPTLRSAQLDVHPHKRHSVFAMSTPGENSAPDPCDWILSSVSARHPGRPLPLLWLVPLCCDVTLFFKNSAILTRHSPPGIILSMVVIMNRFAYSRDC